MNEAEIIRRALDYAASMGASHYRREAISALDFLSIRLEALEKALQAALLNESEWWAKAEVALSGTDAAACSHENADLIGREPRTFDPIYRCLDCSTTYVVRVPQKSTRRQA